MARIARLTIAIRQTQRSCHPDQNPESLRQQRAAARRNIASRSSSALPLRTMAVRQATDHRHRSRTGPREDSPTLYFSKWGARGRTLNQWVKSCPAPRRDRSTCTDSTGKYRQNAHCAHIRGPTNWSTNSGTAKASCNYVASSSAVGVATSVCSLLVVLRPHGRPAR